MTARRLDDAVFDDAVRFGRNLSEGEWRTALLIARAVGAGQCTMHEFAKDAGVPTRVVRRYLERWDDAAEAGLVPPTETLSLDAEPELPPAEVWSDRRRWPS
jgi:hypothetical protein